MKKFNKTLIVGINLGDFGSTGNIMRNTLEYASKNGNYDYLVIVPKNMGNPNTYAYQEDGLNLFQKIIFHKILKQPQTKPDGFYETPYTKRIIKKIRKESKKYKKCFIHLHNIHMANIDLRLLFKYFSKKKRIKKVFYTIHDEWIYTGGCYCSHVYDCNKWKYGCNCECPQKYDVHSFSVAKQCKLKVLFLNKLKSKITFVCVSKWLENNIKNSRLKNINTILNYGETSLNPNGDKEFVIKKYKLEDKKIVLSVSSYWNEWKGTKYIYEIADNLPNNYVYIVVGGSFELKGRKNIIHVNDIEQSELSNFYLAANVYVSTSQNEALGLTTCEAQLCGTPVVAFGHTAIKETIINNATGYIVGEDNNVSEMLKAIIKVVEEKPFSKKSIKENGKRFQKYEHAKRMLFYYNMYNN